MKKALVLVRCEVRKVKITLSNSLRELPAKNCTLLTVL